LSISEVLDTEEIAEMAVYGWLSQLREDQNQDALLSHMDFIVAMTEMLYEVLPSIKIARNMYLLRLEALKNSQSEKPLGGLAQISDVKSVDIPPDVVIAENLRLVHIIEDTLKRREQEAARQGKRFSVYNQLLRKGRERMEKWKVAAMKIVATAERVNRSPEVAKMK